jgi:hypothetical protein
VNDITQTKKVKVDKQLDLAVKKKQSQETVKIQIGSPNTDKNEKLVIQDKTPELSELDALLDEYAPVINTAKKPVYKNTPEFTLANNKKATSPKISKFN